MQFMIHAVSAVWQSADIDDIAALDLLPPCASPEGEGRAAES